ncbi:DUF4345 family protein [Myxococcota bacterium]|nr:DUF4345 family protein [Myxococcota bacterium]
MNLGSAWLGINGVVFLGYGVVCLFTPSMPADYAGIALSTSSGETEIRAMYGGLQAALGAFLIFCALSSGRQAEGLRTMTVLIGGLALGRALGLLLDGLTAYNVYALAYEASAALVALWALRQNQTTVGPNE